MVLNSFSFCLSVELLISPSDLKESLAGYSWLWVFPVVTLNVVYHATLFWPAEVLFCFCCALTPTWRLLGGFLDGSDGKESACHTGKPGSVPGSGTSPGEGSGNPSSIAWEFHGQRNLAGCSPWGRRESDMTVLEEMMVA